MLKEDEAEMFGLTYSSRKLLDIAVLLTGTDQFWLLYVAMSYLDSYK